jgi:hypothetical protein
VEIMRMHALFTERILEHVRGFEWLAFAAAAHHSWTAAATPGLHGEQSRSARAGCCRRLRRAQRAPPTALAPDEASRSCSDRGAGLWLPALDALADGARVRRDEARAA